MKQLAQKLLAQMKKLRTQLFLAYFATLSLFLLIILTVMLVVVQNMMIGQIGSSRLDVLRQIAERANAVKTGSITISNLFQHDPVIQSLLASSNSVPSQETTIYLDELKTKYDSVFNDVGLTYEMMILNKRFTYASPNANIDPDFLTKQLWYRRLYTDLAAANDGEVQYSRTFHSGNTNGVDSYVFAAGRLMHADRGNTVLLLLIDEKRLEELYRPVLSEGSSIYLFDKNGFIVSHTNKKMLGKQFIDANNMKQLYGLDNYSMVKKLGKRYLLSTYYDAQTGWTIVEEIPTDNIFGVLYSAYRVLGVTLAASLFLAVLVSYYMSMRISKPLAELSRALDRFGGADFEPLTTNSGTQEVDYLRESFNNMAGEIFALMNDIRSRSRQKRILEINFLRAQINPHFLYNTLFSIRCLVDINKNAQAAEMISAFTDLLKMTLSVENSVIPLREEIESTRKYLVLQKIRYGSKVNFEFDMPDETLGCFVPSLILQPIVENAIFHGLEAKKSADMIVISSEIVGSDLMITVSDDGIGMQAQQLASVKAGLAEEHRSLQKSIGLSNVHSRIRLNHGEKYGVEIESTPEIGTSVTLHMRAQLVVPNSEVIANDEDINCR